MAISLSKNDTIKELLIMLLKEDEDEADRATRICNITGK